MKVTIVAGARPNFMKIAPIVHAIKKRSGISFRLVHTGQHYDKKMSGDFFEQLNIPDPDVNLGAGGGTQAEQTASIMVGFEQELLAHRPDLVLVVGDVTSTMACTITAKKLGVKVAHVEAGIRSGDMDMPEEINRIVTDSICDYFFTTTPEAGRKLLETGARNEQIFFVGNTMIDTLLANLDNVKKPAELTHEQVEAGNFFLLTLHRPSNVDDDRTLEKLLQVIMGYTAGYSVIFPVHPRTKARLEQIGFTHPNLIQIAPQGYHEFIYLVKNAKAIITDSGGITEEATVLSVPCMTLRNSTERPETVEIGSNELIGADPDDLKPFLEKIMRGEWKKSRIPDLWDGGTAERIVDVLLQDINH